MQISRLQSRWAALRKHERSLSHGNEHERKTERTQTNEKQKTDAESCAKFGRARRNERVASGKKAVKKSVQSVRYAANGRPEKADERK